jgi:hypothetical protein
MEIEYKGFTVVDNGVVLNKFGKSVGYVASPKGYRYLKVDGKQVLKHRFIWEAFNGNVPNGMEIDHIVPISDGGGDELSNLRIVTSKENKHNPRTIDKYKDSNKGKSEKLRHQIIQIDPTSGEIIRTWSSAYEAARTLGVDRSSITLCSNGKLKTSCGYIWKKVERKK